MDKAAQLQTVLGRLAPPQAMALAQAVELDRALGRASEAMPSEAILDALRPLLRTAKPPRVPTLPQDAGKGAAGIKPGAPGKASVGATAPVKAKPPRPEPIPVRLPPAPVTSDSKMAKNRAGLTQKELEHFRDLLLAKRRELLGDVTSMERDALRSGSTNLSSLPLHMADTGTDAYEQEFTLGLVEKDRQLMREINVALAKIQDGSYGICEGTGKPISKPRLEAQPWAKYSIEHARSLERPMFRRAF